MWVQAFPWCCNRVCLSHFDFYQTESLSLTFLLYFWLLLPEDSCYIQASHQIFSCLSHQNPSFSLWSPCHLKRFSIKHIWKVACEPSDADTIMFPDFWPLYRHKDTLLYNYTQHMHICFTNFKMSHSHFKVRRGKKKSDPESEGDSQMEIEKWGARSITTTSKGAGISW